MSDGSNRVPAWRTVLLLCESRSRQRPNATSNSRRRTQSTVANDRINSSASDANGTRRVGPETVSAFPRAGKEF
jgi:hypothetical protein